MGNIFGQKKKETRITEQDKAVLQLKQQRDKLKQYQMKIHEQIEKEWQVAVKLLKDGKKEKAKLLLRKKKFQEGFIEKTNNQMDNIESMVHNLEFAQIESEVIQGLQSGNESLKKIHQMLSLEDVEKIMDETAQSIEYQQEIDALLSNGLSKDDENDVLAELDSIIKINQPKELILQDVNLPDVPSDQIQGIITKKRKTAEPLLSS